MNVICLRGPARENEDGSWTVAVNLGAAAGLQLLQVVPKGGQAYLVLNPKAPETQVVEAAGAESAFAFGAPASTAMPAAREARILCDDPQFQEYAIIKTGVPLSEVSNALQTALDFLLAQTGAAIPADFEKHEVQQRFAKLKTEYAQHRAKIDPPKPKVIIAGPPQG